jgi:A-kinase anchor protein 14
MWSIPTRRKPIPKFTASVYFTYDVSKIKPKVSVKSIIILFCLFIIKKKHFFFFFY